jgi:hypothetical protein
MHPDITEYLENRKERGFAFDADGARALLDYFRMRFPEFYDSYVPTLSVNNSARTVFDMIETVRIHLKKTDPKAYLEQELAFRNANLEPGETPWTEETLNELEEFFASFSWSKEAPHHSLSILP